MLHQFNYLRSFMIMSNSMMGRVMILFVWIATITCFGRSSNAKYNVVCMESEKQALLSFKQHLKDPYNRLSSWLGDDCCQWAGVVCHNLTAHVLQLHLQFEDLGGKINPSLLNLKQLSYLNLSGNDFGGIPIPSFIGSLVSLRYLDLSDAGFGGTIPQQLGNLSSLRDLRLRTFISYDLRVKNLEWVSGLSSLEYLDLSGVNLGKAHNWPQVINMLPSLLELHLPNCELAQIPPLLAVNFTSLTTLDISWNHFDLSQIPRWILSLNSLVSLELSHSKFQGAIPDGFCNLTSLKYLDLSQNNLNSSLPSSTIFGAYDLHFLDLQENEFKGPIPNGIRNMTSLRYLDLSFNHLNSVVPDWFSSFRALETLLLGYNELEGRIPGSLGTLCNLQVIDLSSNKFEGEISQVFQSLSGCILNALEDLCLNDNQFSGNLTDHIEQFKNLSWLSISNNLLEGAVSEVHFAILFARVVFDASGNQLTLKVSPNWTPPFQLNTINMRCWHLGPQFPTWLHSQRNIFHLDLSSTGISDAIPAWFWNLTFQTGYLNLSHNQIYGEIPHILNLRGSRPAIYLQSNQLSGPVPRISSNVVELDLSNNSFSGTLAHFLCESKDKVNQLAILHLQGNILSGEIPDCWMNWKSLQAIKLENNYLTGTIPSSMGFLNLLRSLQLRNNSLLGEIPLSLKSCGELKLVDIGENEFVGTIPTWMGTSLFNLKVLRLRSNKFHGQIPVELCHLTSLQILDLGNNRFTGTIPRCFGKFQNMKSTQFSGDEIFTTDCFVSFEIFREYLENANVVTKGIEVQYSTILKYATSMDLSNNNLHGEIPGELTSLLGLRSLNLSGNHLTGMIPNKIGNMGLLESIDFSRNQLSGEIPSSISGMTFLSYLNVSFNNLSGRIPWSTQLQSFNESSFIGNQLCGPPLTENCNDGGVSPDDTTATEGDTEVAKSEVDWFYLAMGLGFLFGFWCVFGPILFVRSWRYAYFQFLEDAWNKINVVFAKCG